MAGTCKKTILLCVYGEDLSNLFKSELENQNYSVIVSGDGLESVSLYKNHKPDLLLSDINLPKLNGVESMKQILEFDSSAKIILLHTDHDQDIFDDVMECGALKFLGAPFNIDTLWHSVHVALSDVE